MDIRGRHEAMVYRVEWQDEVLSDFFTVPASLSTLPFAKPVPPPASIALSWLDVDASFTPEELPAHLGRVSEAHFVINDPRVSRLHASMRVGRDSCKNPQKQAYS